MPVPGRHAAVRPKSTGTAYLLLACLGSFGAHKFYLGRPGLGLLWACSLGLFGIGTFVDVFTLPAQVRTANDKTPSAAIKRYGRRQRDEEVGESAPRSIDFERYRSASQSPVLRKAAVAPTARPQPFGRRG